MTGKNIYIKTYDWSAKVLFDAEPSDHDRVMYYLERIGAPEDKVLRASKLLLRGTYDNAFTASNAGKRMSIIVLTPSSSEAEFLNTISHEVRHLVDDIAGAYGMERHGEEVGYLTGDITYYLTEQVQHHICSCNPKGL